MEGGELHNIFEDAFNKCDLEEIKKANIYHTNIIFSILKESLTGDEPLSNLYKKWNSQQIRYINFPKKPIQIQSGNYEDLQISESIYLYTLKDLACYISKKLKFHTRKKRELSEKFNVFNENLEEFKIKKETQQIQQHEMEQKTEYQLQKSQKENEELRKENSLLKVENLKKETEKKANECNFIRQIKDLKINIDDLNEINDANQDRINKKNKQFQDLNEMYDKQQEQIEKLAKKLQIQKEENKKLQKKYEDVVEWKKQKTK